MRRTAAVLVAAIGALLVPAVAFAHPLGNFTINHYAGLEVAPTEIRLDVVIDQAEIPAFQERLRLDSDEDGTVSDEEAGAARESECGALAPFLNLSVDGAAAGFELTAAGLSFPSGAGGLPTMRLACGFRAPVPDGFGGGRDVAFEDRSSPSRLGWREVVVTGNGVTVSGRDVLGASLSRRLTDYPADRLATPLAMDTVAFRAADGGPTVAPFVAPDALPIAGEVRAAASHAADAATVPGGAAVEVPAVFGTAELSPGVLLAAILTAVALGAGHALTPGHGKTLVAAYLVGTRGTALHAAGLGLSVTVAHTFGILLLAALVVAAGAALPTELVVRWLPVVAASTIVGIGAWMLVGEVRRRRAGHDHAIGHDHPHRHGDGPSHHHAGHAHGPASAITWRSLFALGLAGGIVPSTSALLILLGTIASGRPAFGVILVVAFGLGMAVVLAGLGLALVVARDRVERLTAGSRAEAVLAWMPVTAGAFVVVVGVWLTGQALLGAAAF